MPAADLFDKTTADSTGTEDEQFDRLRGIEKETVRRTHGRIAVLSVYNGAYRTLRRTLRNRQNIYALAGERVKEGSGNTAFFFHAVADNRYNGAVVYDFYGIYIADADFVFELGVQGFFYRSAVFLLNAKTDCIFGTGLRNEQHGNARARNCGEYARGNTVLVFHSRTGHAYHCGFFKTAYTAYRSGRRKGADTDSSSACGRIVAV